MFQVTIFIDQSRRYKVIGEFPTYLEARRACRRALIKYWQGLVSSLPEVTRIGGGVYANLNQPTSGNYGRETFGLDGYQTSYVPNR